MLCGRPRPRLNVTPKMLRSCAPPGRARRPSPHRHLRASARTPHTSCTHSSYRFSPRSSRRRGTCRTGAPARVSPESRHRPSGSGGPQHCSFRCLRQFYRNEILFWIQIVFAGFVNYSRLMALGSPLIGQQPIYFPQPQRRRVVLVPHADDKPQIESSHATSTRSCFRSSCTYSNCRFSP